MLSRVGMQRCQFTLDDKISIREFCKALSGSAQLMTLLWHFISTYCSSKF